MSNGHARLGPSNPRWVYCPGSVKAEEPYPDISGAAAIDGTGSHLLLELCLNDECMADDYEGKVIGVNDPDNPNGWLVSEDRIVRVNQCLNYVKRRVVELSEEHSHCDVVVQAESKSNPGAKYGRTDWWGTCDITIAVMFEEECSYLEVIDYKDGRGFVSEKDNSQLISYAGGKLYELNQRFSVTSCRMTIVQPRTTPPVRYCSVYSTAIFDRLDELNEAASKTDDDNAPLIAGSHCRWCKHKANCNVDSVDGFKRLESMKNNGTLLFDSTSGAFGDVSELSGDKLVEIADSRESIMKVFEKVDTEIQRRIELAPGSVKGYAMKPGKSSRGWIGDEESIVKVLKARRLKLKDIYKSKLITPAQVMKLDSLTDEQKKKLESSYIVRTVGAVKLTKVKVVTEEPSELFKDVAVKNETPSWI